MFGNFLPHLAILRVLLWSMHELLWHVRATKVRPRWDVDYRASGYLAGNELEALVIKRRNQENDMSSPHEEKRLKPGKPQRVRRTFAERRITDELLWTYISRQVYLLPFGFAVTPRRFGTRPTDFSHFRRVVFAAAAKPRGQFSATTRFKDYKSKTGVKIR